MSEEEKYIKCKNCHQNISESKIFLHEGFCLRNNKLCPECDKVFLIKEYEEHIKTHNTKKNPDKIPNPKVQEIPKKTTAISEHRKNCHHNQEIPIPKKREVKVDDNLGLKQCEYCINMFEDLQTHLKICEVKKMIEKENVQYYSDLEKRKKADDDLAQKLAKEKFLDISKDEQLAKDLQNNMSPIVDINKDEEMALNLQKQFQKENMDISKDEEYARNLQKQFRNNINISEDEKLAKELQNEYSQEYNNAQQDEEYARILEQQERANNNHGRPYNYGFNYPENNYNNNDFQ